MIPRLCNKPYKKRLTELNFFPLTKLRLGEDLVAVFKIFKGCSKANPDAYFTVDCTANITRNNGYKIIGKHFETNEL